MNKQSIPLMVVCRTSFGNRCEATIHDYGKGDIGISLAWQRQYTRADTDEASRIIAKHLGMSLEDVNCYRRRR